MEVHAHTHTPRKKWTHYFWEFFMLFLAVFAGFLAENQREHFVEQKRERQYMRSMNEDLAADTVELAKIFTNIQNSIQNIDSMLLLLANAHITEKEIARSYHYTFPALNTIPIVFNDRTMVQLKNSGNMRIIENQPVNDALINYWNHIEIIKEAMNRHTFYRSKGRDLETKLFNTAENFLKKNHLLPDSTGNVQVIDHDPRIVKEYSNTIAYCGVILQSILMKIEEQSILAVQLIKLIKKEYHL